MECRGSRCIIAISWLFILISILFACSKTTLQSETAIRIEKINIVNNDSFAHTAKIVIELSGNADIQIRYWKENESGAGFSDWSIDKRKHTVPLFLLEEESTYFFEVIVSVDNGLTDQLEEVYHFHTAAVPEWIKDFYNESDNLIDETLSGYYLFASGQSPGCLYIVNNKGKIVWYRTTPNVIKSFRLSTENTILIIEDEDKTPFGDGNILLETTLAGDTVVYLRKGQRGFDKTIHHDLMMNRKGNLILVTNEFKNGKPGDGLIELDKSGKKTWEWSTFDVQEEIDPSIIDQPWINSVFIDKDNNYILSLRSLNQVWKVDSSTGKVIWKIGEGGDFDMDIDSRFLAQHFAYRRENGELVLFDNGGPGRPYTRVLSFELDEESLQAKTKTVLQLPSEYYSPIMGNASFLPDDNILITSSTTGTILKMDRSGKIIWKLKAKGIIYRAEYLSDPFRLNR